MKKGTWFEESDHILADINITPLVDVSLVLQIIFMITAPMMVQGADVRLPRTQRMDTLPETQLIVSVNAEGQVLIDGDAVPFDELEARLSPRITPGRPVLFHGDERVPYGRIMQVMAIMQGLGADIGLVTEPLPERRDR